MGGSEGWTPHEGPEEGFAIGFGRNVFWPTLFFYHALVRPRSL